MEPTYGDYDVNDVPRIDILRKHLAVLDDMDDPADRADKLADILLNGHRGSSGYITFGNNKISKNTGIFNMNSATDCPNANSDPDNQTETGVCQVPWSACYAHKAENQYDDALPKRRRQEYLWDHVDAWTFADAILRVKERKRSAFDHLRVSEAGDFRHDQDIIKWNTIAKIIGDEINVYTYSASHKLDWSHATDFTVNQSNGFADYGDRRFTALPKEADLPEGMVWCPFDLSDKSGDDRPKCGECMLCIRPEGPDVAIHLH